MRKTAGQLKIGDQIIDKEGLEWTVAKIEPVPATGRLEIRFDTPMMLAGSQTTGRFRRSEWFEIAQDRLSAFEDETLRLCQDASELTTSDLQGAAAALVKKIWQAGSDSGKGWSLTVGDLKARLTDGEHAWLKHMQRFGSAGYPVKRMGRKWWVDQAFGAGGCPSPFKTKTEAIGFCDRYLQVLLDKLAGRM